MRPRLLPVLIFLGLAGAAISARADDGRNVTIQAESEPVLSVLKRLCSAHGYNWSADDAALQRAGKVSLSLTDVTFDDALEAICAVSNLEGKVIGLEAHPIVIIRMKSSDRPEARDRPPLDERPASASARPSGNRFLEGLGPGTLRVDRAPPPAGPSPAAAASPAPVTSQAPALAGAQPIAPAPAPAAQAAPQASGAIVVGVVVEIGAEGVTLKETSGEPRAFIVPPADVDTLRNERLSRGLSHLKKGDRVSLEYRADAGRLVIMNLVGGGKPADNP